MGVADDVVAPERQDGARDRLRQGGQLRCPRPERAPVARASSLARRGGGDRDHVPRPARSISTRALTGRARGGRASARLAKRIFTGHALHDANEVAGRVVGGQHG